MAVILSIETSAMSCSACASVDGELIVNRIKPDGRNHSELLGVFIDEIITELENKNLKLDAVAVSAGPGSYTGLRIGVSTAKGICYGYDIPLISIPTLQLIANTAEKESKIEGTYIPMIDARRMEVYTAKYKAGKVISDEVALIVDETSYREELTTETLVFCGDGSGKCKDVITSNNAQFVDDVIATAENMIPLAENAFNNQEFVDLAYFEPNYLKAFQTTVSKKNVLGR